MKGALVLALALCLAAPAQAATKRLTVDDTARWATPQKFGPNRDVQFDIYVNGRYLRADYLRRGMVWDGRGILARAKTSKRRGPIRFRIANFRERDANVRIVYRKL